MNHIMHNKPHMRLHVHMIYIIQSFLPPIASLLIQHFMSAVKPLPSCYNKSSHCNQCI